MSELIAEVHVARGLKPLDENGQKIADEPKDRDKAGDEGRRETGGIISDVPRIYEVEYRR